MALELIEEWRWLVPFLVYVWIIHSQLSQPAFNAKTQ